MRYLWCCRCMVWACCKCIAKYRSWSQLDVHLLSHGREMVNDVKDDALWCGSCTRSVDTHCNSVDIEDIFLCAHCDQVFSDKLLIELHFKIDHREMFPQTSWFICQVCGSRLFMRLCDIRKHMQDDHCQFHFDVEPSVVSKLQDTMFPCQVCGVLCVLSKYCVDHKSSAPVSPALTSSSKCIEHASLFPNCHSCQKCDDSFDNCTKLWSHMFLNHEDDDFVCNLCPPGTEGVIKYPYILLKHMGRYHAMNFVIPAVFEHLKAKSQVLVNGVVSFKCVQCPCIVQDFETLKTHIKSHSKESDFVCFVCDKLLSRTNILIDHIRSVHQKIRDFSCHLCKGTFSTVYNLREHMNIHTASKKHVCEVCGQAFVHKASLNLHKFSHGTPFTCNHCGKNYANPLTFKTHILENHSNLPKYVCDICGKELKTKSILQKHLVVHSNERPFVCPICNASYKMKKHLSHHHRQRHVNSKSQF
uniref:PR domain zinc finger protein 5 n=1 Tax=Cacopsylla melanoneura TaxID=428564 RepID=A0A8D9ELR5_9HEMI